ncbi:hypothetical protein MMC16_001501 [Acarospora aff. strigata]|nr:hypothetical protein [Acarospora aff. strigata]
MSAEAGEGSGDNNSPSARNALWRGHSDSDVLALGLGPYSSMLSAGVGEGDGETWMDFLREGSSGTRLDGDRQAQVDARRATMMAVDRKRRLTAHEDDLARRRSSSGAIHGQAHGRPVRSSMAPPPQPRSENPVSTSNSTRDNIVIDLSSSSPERPVPQTPSAVRIRNRNSREITIPRQFIVHPPVEANCGFAAAQTANIEVVDLTGDGSEDVAAATTTDDFQAAQGSPLEVNRRDSSLGGGQEVRLCNPCVPDPNPLPPPAYAASPSNNQSIPPSPNFSPSEPSVPLGVILDRPQRSSSLLPSLTDRSPTARESQTRREAEALLERWRNLDGAAASRNQEESFEAFLGRRRRRGFASDGEDSLGHDVIPVFGPPSYHRHRHTPSTPVPPRYSSIFGSPPGASINDQQYPSHRPQHARHRAHASMNTVHTSTPRYRSMLDIDVPFPLSATAATSTAAPAPVLREEDECPICHTALPPKGPDGSETAREQHVASCIESHFSSSTPRTSHPPPAVATAATITASAATPSQAGNSTGIQSIPNISANVVTASSAASASSGIRPFPPHAPHPIFQQQHRPRRSAGMVVYHASEKDCVGSDGVDGQECVICFEEFAVGDEMGRLECLCKFHKVSPPLFLGVRVCWIEGG